MKRNVTFNCIICRPLSGLCRKTLDGQIASSGYLTVTGCNIAYNFSKNCKTKDQCVASDTLFANLCGFYSYVMRPRHAVGPPPRTYVCYRCNQPGHYISSCPHNVKSVSRMSTQLTSLLLTDD